MSEQLTEPGSVLTMAAMDRVGLEAEYSSPEHPCSIFEKLGKQTKICFKFLPFTMNKIEKTFFVFMAVSAGSAICNCTSISKVIGSVNTPWNNTAKCSNTKKVEKNKAQF